MTEDEIVVGAVYRGTPQKLGEDFYDVSSAGVDQIWDGPDGTKFVAFTYNAWSVPLHCRLSSFAAWAESTQGPPSSAERELRDQLSRLHRHEGR